MSKNAVNGCGRIGRLTLLNRYRKGLTDVGFANDPGMTAADLVHYLKYDTTHGVAKEDITAKGNVITLTGGPNGGMSFQFSQERTPEAAWDGKEVGLVYECSGFYLERDAAQQHLDAGASRVILSGPHASADYKAVYGVNHKGYDPAKHKVVSATSCTTNCLAPPVSVLRQFGFLGGQMATVHAYTADQRLIDTPHKDKRRARAAGRNIIPTSTGGAKMIAEIFPDLKGKINGMALRVPVESGSGVFLSFCLQHEPSVDDLKDAFTKAAGEGDLFGVLGINDEPLVSHDFLGTPFGSVVDFGFISKDGPFYSAWFWYDNEYSFVNQYRRMANHMIAK